MSLSPEDDLCDQSTVPTPRIKLDDEFINSQQEKMNVYLRIRPLLPEEIKQDTKICICVEDDHVVRAVAPLDSAKFKSSAHDNSALEQIFRFTRTFGPEVDQIQFFEETMKTTLDNFIRGQNELVFAYGSTGSGKTYTMQGGLGGLGQPGVIPLTIHLLFSSIKGKQVMSPSFKPHKYSDVMKLSKVEQDLEETARQKLLSHLDSEDFDDSKSLSGKSSVSVSTIFSEDSLDMTSHPNLTDKEISTLESTVRMKNIACESVTMQGKDVLFSVWVSFVEVYNEIMYDLLEPVTSNKRTRLSLKEDENRNIYVRGLREIRVTSSEEALKLFGLGKRNLRIASTKMNYKSSRSHCIFTIKIIRVLGVDSPLSARVNRLSYCDLAGSERTAKTQNTGMRLKEAGNINTSLLVLGRCIESLRQPGPNDKKVVPYRDSKLTRLFSAYFTGKGKASMIINVSPASHIFDETLNVLKFSALAKQVISNDLSMKPLSHWDKEISRLTETWEKSCTRWSSFCKTSPQKDSVDIIAETSVDDENDLDVSFDEVLQRDQLIEKLLGHVNTLKSELKRIIIEKENLEAEIRAQVSREFAENFVQIDTCYREQLKDLEESDVAVNQKVHRELRSDVSKEADEEDNAEDSEEDSDDEKAYTSAHEGTPPPPILSSAIEDSESEMHGDKGGQKNDQKSGRSSNDSGKTKSSPRKSKERKQNSALKESEAKRYETLLRAKDEEIELLRRRVEEQNNAMSSFEKKVEELEKAAKSKDADLDALRIKIQENKMAFDKDSVEYEKILSSITAELKEKDQAIALHDTNVKELENIINKRNDEIIQVKKQYESAIESKDVELKEYLKSLNSRAQEITDLKGRIEEMEKVIALNEKKLKECNSVLSLKDVEISFLKGSDVGPKANGIKQYETALRCKDEEIIQLKKKVEAGHMDLIEKEKELERYKNIINTNNKEVAVPKKKLEENSLVDQKEDELKECETKEEEITELKKTIEKLKEEVTSKEKEIEDFKNIVSLKNTEVYLLKEKIEENEVIVSKPKELLESEEIVKSKDESIARLKKEAEDHRRSIFFKDKELEECRNNLNSKEKELSALKQKLEEHELIIPKSSELKEYKKSLNSKEAEIMKLKKKIDDLEGSVASKEILIQELESTIQKGGDILVTKDSEIHELQKQLSDLKNRNKKSRDGRTKDDNNIIKSQGIEITNLNGKIEKLNRTVATKDSKIKEANSTIRCLESEVINLNDRIGKLDKALSAKEKLVKDLEVKLKKTEEVLSSKNEVLKLQRIFGAESTKSEGGDIKICEKEMKMKEMLYPDKEKIIDLQKRIAEFESEASESKAPEWQDVHHLTKLVQELSKTFASEFAGLSEMEKKYNALLEQYEEGVCGKKLMEQEFNKKFEEQEASLSKRNDEIKELQCRLDEKEKAEQELNKKLEEQEESLSGKNDVIKELEHKLECKLAEEENLKEQNTVKENQMQTFGELIKVLEQTEFHSKNRISDLEKELNKKKAEVQELINKSQEEERKVQETEERWKEAEERWKVTEEEKKVAEEEKRKAEEEKKIAEEGKRQAEEEKMIAEEEKRQAEEEKRRVEEERQKAIEEEEERWRTEKENKKKKSMKKRTVKIQTESCELEKHERGSQTETSEYDKSSVDSGDEQCGVVPLHYRKKHKCTTTEEEDIETHRKCSYSDEESEFTKVNEEVEASEVIEESGELFDQDDDDKCKSSPVGSGTNHETQVPFGEGLVSCLQWIEMIAAQKIVKLDKENRNYCKKLVCLSDDLGVMRMKLAAAELALSEKENWPRKSKSEDSVLEPRQESIVSSPQLLHLIETLQTIEHTSGENITKLSDEKLRLVRENKSLIDQLKTSAVELQLVNQEIEKKDEEYCKIQSHLRKKDARIVCLELEVTEAQEKLRKLEAKSKMKLLEEQTQHGIEVEQVMALKRQAETNYRSLERKFTAATGNAEESMQTKTQTGSTEDLRQRKKQGRPRRFKGRKRTSAEEDEDFVPSQKKRMVKSRTYFEDDDTSTHSPEPEQSHSTEASSSSFQRLQEFVSESSPVVNIKAVAQRMATFLSPKSGSEDKNSSTLKKKKRKLFNSALAASLVTSPVQESVKKISPKKTVNRKFRSKKDPE